MEKVNIIKKPVITEKSLRDAQEGIFTFEVFLGASKSQIKQAVENLFNVHVQSITTVINKGKKRRGGRRRMQVIQTDSKKARVKLQTGEKIDLFEVTEKK